VETSALPVIGKTHPDVVKHSIYSGFETGQYQRINDTFYYTANELGMCPHVLWDLVTRAALWSAPNSSGPWTRLATLRNGSHIETLCEPKTPCRKPCGGSCCSGTEDQKNFVTWAPTLIHAPSSVNESGKDVWNFFYSSNQNAHYRDNAFNGITWAVSTTDSMLGPYVDVVGENNSALPPGGEGVINVAVNETHSFSAWKLRNGSWVSALPSLANCLCACNTCHISLTLTLVPLDLFQAGFKNNIPGATSFSAGLIVPVGDPQTPGGAWKLAGPNLASGSDCSNGFCYGPENPVVTTMSSNGKFYLSVYDALTQPPASDDPRLSDASSDTGSVCGGSKCNRIGIGFSADGVTWKYSSLVAVQTEATHPCGQVRTPLGLVPEPERCKGCYSVLFTGIAGSFRPVCRAIVRNTNE
jgi:hypothetical protein